MSTLLPRLIRYLFICALVALAGWMPVSAIGSSGVISHGYRYSDKVEVTAGALVSAKNNQPSTVELAYTKNVDQLLGVVANLPVATISSQDKQTQVVLSGVTDVLVSDVNGPIRAGDKITASPIPGVGMLVTDNGQVVGTAQQALDTENAATRYINDTSGKGHKVHIGVVATEVNATYYQQPGSNLLPPFLQHLANNLAGGPVSVLRILTATFILLCGFAYGSILVFTSVRTSVISLGRNPLAARDIRKNLLQMALVALGVIITTLLATYLLVAV